MSKTNRILTAVNSLSPSNSICFKMYDHITTMFILSNEILNIVGSLFSYWNAGAITVDFLRSYWKKKKLLTDKNMSSGN